MKEKEFYCPLYKNKLSQPMCDELRLDVDYNHIVDENKPHLMTIEQIKQGTMTCVKCQIENFKDYTSNLEVISKIEELEEKYKDDEEALITIQMNKIDIAYIERKQKEGNYDGQTPTQFVNCLEAHLAMWH